MISAMYKERRKRKFKSFQFVAGIEKEFIQDMASVSVSNADINSQNIKVILTLCE